MLDLNDEAQGFQPMPKMASRVKNGVAIMDENSQEIYVIGGWDEKETQNTVFRYVTQGKDAGCMLFDGFLASKTEGHACVAAPSGSIFVFGGYDGVRVSDRVMKYNINTKESVEVFGQRLSEPRENLVAEMINGNRIVVASGWNGHASSSKVDLFSYDASKDSIKRLDADKFSGKLTEED